MFDFVVQYKYRGDKMISQNMVEMFKEMFDTMPEDVLTDKYMQKVVKCIIKFATVESEYGLGLWAESLLR